jgi:hypothetical protein
VAAFLVFTLPSPWPGLLRGASARALGRQAALLFLNGLLIAYALALVAAFLGTGLALWRWYWPTGSESWPRPQLTKRLLLLLAASLISLVLLETGAAGWLAWLHRNPALRAVGLISEHAPAEQAASTNRAPSSATPPHHPLLPHGENVPEGRLRGKERLAPRPGRGSATEPLRILVIGESSARGEPYHPWLSVPQIVAWRLKRVFPRRPIEVDMWAEGGATLEVMHHKLAGLSYRPDALLLYVGHNEFQARYAWMRDVDYYRDDDSTVPRRFPAADIMSRMLAWSPLRRLVLELRDRQQVDQAPSRHVTRKLVDRPLCTPQETADVLADFQKRLEAIALYSEAIGMLPVFVIPPCNDAGFDPNRSVLPPDTPKSERAHFVRAVASARVLERTRPDLATRAWRALVKAHPEFAEAHFHLARLMERRGAWEAARHHYALAREHDALPLRCPESLRKAFRDVAARHPRVLLVDGPRVLERKSPHGIVDDRFFHDAQHPNLKGYAALAEDLLDQLVARSAFGWPTGTPVPLVDVEACYRHFQLDSARWEQVCRRGHAFFHAMAGIRYDPKLRIQRAGAYARAAIALHDGWSPAEARVPGWPLVPAPAPSHRIAP